MHSRNSTAFSDLRIDVPICSHSLGGVDPEMFWTENVVKTFRNFWNYWKERKLYNEKYIIRAISGKSFQRKFVTNVSVSKNVMKFFKVHQLWSHSEFQSNDSGKFGSLLAFRVPFIYLKKHSQLNSKSAHDLPARFPSSKPPNRHSNLTKFSILHPKFFGTTNFYWANLRPSESFLEPRHLWLRTNKIRKLQ